MQPLFAGLVIAFLMVFTTTCYFFRIPDNLRTNGRIGHWGVPDAELNWCEQDYMLSEWVAEPVNTVTNVIFLLLPGAFLAAHETSREVQLMAILIMVIGVGSILYHLTLRYTMMLVDELPMFWFAMFSAWSVFRRLWGWSGGTWYVAHSVVVTLLILLTPQQTALHQAMRGIMATSFSICLVILSWGIPALRQRLASELTDKRRQVPVFLDRHVTVMFIVLVASVMCWLLDNWYCPVLRSLPWGIPYPHLHAWWHLLIAPSVHCALVVFQADDLRKSPHLTAGFRYGLPAVWC